MPSTAASSTIFNHFVGILNCDVIAMSVTTVAVIQLKMVSWLRIFEKFEYRRPFQRAVRIPKTVQNPIMLCFSGFRYSVLTITTVRVKISRLFNLIWAKLLKIFQKNTIFQSFKRKITVKTIFPGGETYLGRKSEKFWTKYVESGKIGSVAETSLKDICFRKFSHSARWARQFFK